MRLASKNENARVTKMKIARELKLNRRGTKFKNADQIGSKLREDTREKENSNFFFSLYTVTKPAQNNIVNAKNRRKSITHFFNDAKSCRKTK